MYDVKDTYLFRPIRREEAPQLLTLVQQSSGGLSSLQPRLAFLEDYICLLYTSPSPRDKRQSRMPSSA